MSPRFLKSLRTAAIYTGLALGVSVGGIAIGALIVAPAVSRAKPILARAMSADVKASLPPAPRVATLRANASRLAGSARRAASEIPMVPAASMGLVVALLLGVLLYRRRGEVVLNAPSAMRLPVLSVSKPSSSKSGGTPRAVVALAESGASVAEIARRTRMPLDAVAMCLSMGSLGARQLRPPTA